VPAVPALIIVLDPHPLPHVLGDDLNDFPDLDRTGFEFDPVKDRDSVFP